MCEKDERFMEIYREINESLQRTVRISHDEATRIAAADLLAKYKGAKKRSMSSEADMLECVLTKYYLTRAEFELYT